MHSSEKKQKELVSDGLDGIGKRFHLIARELKILNRWLKVTDGNHEGISLQQWEDIKLDYQAAADSLTEAIVQTGEILKNPIYGTTNDSTGKSTIQGSKLCKDN
jgi:hypothetical protein